MKVMRVRGGLKEIKGARKNYNPGLKERNEGHWEGVGIGYEFLFTESGL